MIVVIAELNKNLVTDYLNIVKLKDGCLKAGAEHVFVAQTADELKDVLRENKYNKILLFSNFPPNSSYPDSGKTMKQVDKGSYTVRAFEADSYSKSMDFFLSLLKDPKKFIKIHFITGAPKQVLKDEQLKSLSPDTKITVLRKKDYMDENLDYNKLIQNYVVEKIQAITSKNPFI
jgi:hypothetical protein